ncbi:MAG: alpha/beta fold hydrolase [Flammeovirgaceae bacterium]
MRRYKKWLISFCAFALLLVLMDSCLQFRMSKREVRKFFADKSHAGTLHTYVAHEQKINYLHVGNEHLPLIVFFHGSPGSLSAFIDFMADTALLKRAQLISVDRPGFGDSNFGYAEKSVKQQAAVLAPLLEKFKQDRPVILVGHSLGGPVIARIAMDFPDLVDGLVIVAGSIDPDLEPNEWFRAPLATPFIKWLLPRSIRASNDEIYHLKPELQDMLPLWKNIRAKTIVIQGKKDVLVDPGNAAFAKKMMTHAEVTLIEVEGMNHFVPWTNPELIRHAAIQMVHDLSHQPQP